MQFVTYASLSKNRSCPILQFIKTWYLTSFLSEFDRIFREKFLPLKPSPKTICNQQHWVSSKPYLTLVLSKNKIYIYKSGNQRTVCYKARYCSGAVWWELLFLFSFCFHSVTILSFSWNTLYCQPFWTGKCCLSLTWFHHLFCFIRRYYDITLIILLVKWFTCLYC